MNNAKAHKEIVLERIFSIISLLQKEGKMPQGQYEYSYDEKSASHIFKVKIGGRVYYFKKLKPRFSSYSHDLEEQLIVEYKALTKFYEIFNEYENYNVPKPIFFSPEDLLLVTEEIKGTSILDICRKFASRFKTKELRTIDVCTRVGEFFRIYHESETYPYTIQDLDESEDYIRQRLFDGIFSQEEEARISAYLERIHSEIKGEIHRYNKNPIHSDVSPCNIFFDGEDINVLDFADHRIGHHFQDLIGFKLMLERQLGSRIKYRQYAKEELVRAFSNGYGFDYDAISNDKLYNLYLLSILAVFVKTLAYWKEEPLTYKLSLEFFKGIKDKIMNCLEYYETKKKILSIVEP